MEQEKGEPAWSDQADAVYIAAVSQLDELSGYGERMNVLLNLSRHVIAEAVVNSIQEELGRTRAAAAFVELGMLTRGMQFLADEFAENIKKMPNRTESAIHSEHGCGTCASCKAATRAAYGDGTTVLRPSKQSMEAIDAIINTIIGGKPKNPDN